MRLLTTGPLSGLGRHIHETLGGMGWTRPLDENERRQIKQQGVDVIIHCAFTNSQSVDSSNLYDYLADNVLLTEEMVSVPHKKFVFISSVDVYPKGLDCCSEDTVIEADLVDGIYGITKLMSEAIVRQRCPNHLILRCTSLLGRHSRKNSMRRILEDDSCKLTLSGDSRFNYVLHSDVCEFIQYAIEHGVGGIFNVASSESIQLSTVAASLGKQVSFGAYRYEVGNIDNCKVSSVFPAFQKSSMEVIDQFLREQAT